MAEEVGFEPTGRYRHRGFQGHAVMTTSVPFHMVQMTRVERVTSCTRNTRSSKLSYIWSLATRMGLEPMISAVTGRHSNQLNYLAVYVIISHLQQKANATHQQLNNQLFVNPSSVQQYHQPWHHSCTQVVCQDTPRVVFAYD